jgi:PhnB protein
MQLGVHLTFPGTCEAAFRFYEGVLGGTLGLMQTYGQSPGAEQVTPEWRAKIIHGSIAIDGRELFGADVRVDDYEPPRGFYLLIGISGLANAERIFAALAENGSVNMPLQKTFWSPGFGVVVDRFGVPWEVSCESAPAT